MERNVQHAARDDIVEMYSRSHAIANYELKAMLHVMNHTKNYIL
jgi:hypothetical protein